MKNLISVFILLLFTQCAPVLDLPLEPVKDFKTEIYYHQGTPFAISKMNNSIVSTYIKKTTTGSYQLFLAALNKSATPINIGHNNVDVTFLTSIGPIQTGTMEPRRILEKKIRSDNLDIALTGLNSALNQATYTTGTVGGSQVNVKTTQSGLNAANQQMLNQKSSNSANTTNSLKNSLLFKSTVMPNDEISGIVYLKNIPSQIKNNKGKNLSTSNVKIKGIGISIRCGKDTHQSKYTIPEN